MKTVRGKSLFKKLVLQFVVFGLLFYVVPIPVLVSSNTDPSFLTNMLLILNPTVCFVMNIMFTLRNKFNWLVPLLSGVCFTPSVFIFYNTTAVPYIFSYIVLSYIGAAVGVSITKDKDVDK